MPSLRINFPHRHLGRVNTHITSPSETLLEHALGLPAITDTLLRRQEQELAEDVPLVLKLSKDEDAMLDREVRVAEEEWRQNARMNDWERMNERSCDGSSSASSIPILSRDSSLADSKRLSRSEGSSAFDAWSGDFSADVERQSNDYPEHRQLRQSIPCSASYASSSGGYPSACRLSSDSSASSESSGSSEYNGYASIAKAVSFQRTHTTPITRGDSNAPFVTSKQSMSFTPQAVLERARTLAILEGVLEPSTVKRHRPSSLAAKKVSRAADTTRPASVPEAKAERARALATLAKAASRRSSQGTVTEVELEAPIPETELEPYVQLERAKTLAILTGASVPPPDRDYGNSLHREIFEYWHRQEVAEAEAMQELRSLHEQHCYIPMDPGYYNQPLQTNRLRGMAGWMHTHLWNYLSPQDRPFLMEWYATAKALLLEVEDACCECDTLRVARVFDLSTCTAEEFVVLMRKVARRGWKDVIWMVEKEDDFPMRLAPASRDEKKAFDLNLRWE